MNKVQLEITEHQDGIDFLINNFNNLGILTIQKLKEFALKRNGYFRYDLKQFGIKRKLNEKELLQIFELLELDITILRFSKLEKNLSNTNRLVNFKKYIEEKFSITKMIVNFGTHKGNRWSNVPFSYLEWIYTQNKNKFAYEEMKRRKNTPLYIENETIQIGEHKGKKWIDVPTDYLQWILSTFENEDTNYKFAKIILSQRKQ